VVVIAGPSGVRRVPIDDFIIGPNKTALQRGEMVLAIELPLPAAAFGAAYTRLTRRRGTDLASITLCCGVDGDGITRLAFGSVGPRAFLVVDDSGILADPAVPIAEKAESLDRMFHQASPSPKSLRASPDYRLAMLRVLGARALDTALSRLTKDLAGSVPSRWLRTIRCSRCCGTTWISPAPRNAASSENAVPARSS
jgi:carbon-monoxide dehydrogenase medium subunit